jgi:hypothetical protein
MHDRTQLLRHTLAILAHIGDLLEWGERLARGEYRWEAGAALGWEPERERVFAALARFDARLRTGPPEHPVEQIFQGPIADALTHVGQLTLLRRLAGAPVCPESYARASIAAGQVGFEQPGERVKFDGDASVRRG